MFLRPAISRCCRGVWPKCILLVLLSLLVLQFVQYKLWESLVGSEKENWRKKAEGEEPRRGGDSRSTTTRETDATKEKRLDFSISSMERLFRSGRVDSSGDYLVVDDICVRWSVACGGDSATTVNASSSRRRPSSSPSVLVSLVTQSSVSNLYHLLDLSSSSSFSSSSRPRWGGAVSVAVFAPTLSDIAAAFQVLHALRLCGVDGDRVRFHLVTLNGKDARGGGGGGGESPGKNLSILSLVSSVSGCARLRDGLKTKFKAARNYVRAGEEPAPVSIHGHVTTSSSTSAPASISYPVNVLRNIALANAASKYVLVIDVDMLPSLDLERHFAAFVEREEAKIKSNDAKGRIAAALERGVAKNDVDKVAYVVPAYELKDDDDDDGGGVSSAVPSGGLHRLWGRGHLPENKSELLRSIDASAARPFYSRVCWKCQKYTDYERWESAAATDDLSVVFTRQWADPWEPFFIVEKANMPLYDERFKQYGFNRIQQVCELHIAGYEFRVLNNAFLLHVGFKENDSFHAEKRRENDENRLLFRKFKQELKQKYPQIRRRCY